MKKYLSILLSLCVLLAAMTLFTACDSRYLNNCRQTIDGLGLSTLLSDQAFFAIGEKLRYNGQTLTTVLTYDYTTAYSIGKTNLDDSLKMTVERVPEEGGKYQKTYQYLATRYDLEGLTLPEGIGIGTSLLDALKLLSGDNDQLDHFKPTKEALYEMILCENKDGARITLIDMKRATDTSGYRFQYQILYTDSFRVMSEEGSLLMNRSLILSFDNEKEGNPLTMIEVTFECRHKI